MWSTSWLAMVVFTLGVTPTTAAAEGDAADDLGENGGRYDGQSFDAAGAARAAAAAQPPTPGGDRGPAHDRTQALFGLDAPAHGPFPADFFTVRDEAQNTCLRVSLPEPDCSVEPSECLELDAVNQLDGFNVTPRLAIPFSGPIDLATVDSRTIFLVTLGSTLTDGAPSCLAPAAACEGEDACLPPDAGRVVGVDQVVWDPDTNTLYAEAGELLDQHARYALVVTSGVLDVNGNRIEPSQEFKRAISDEQEDDGAAVDPAVLAYGATLREAIAAARLAGTRRDDVAAASVFSTLSASAVLQKIRDDVEASPPPDPAQFTLGPGGVRTVFPVSAITQLVFNRQTKTTGPLQPQDITSSRLALLNVVPGAVGQIAFGKYRSPSYLRPDDTMPPVSTFSGTPAQTGTNDVYLDVFVPSGTKPDGGWPVVLFAYGTGDSKDGAPFNVASELAAHGLATVAINTVGHGLGPHGTLSVTRSSGTVTFPSGGRSIDLNGDGTFDPSEGSQARASYRFLFFNRDAMQQNVADLVQLVRVIEAGVDWDGDGARDLDPSRIYLLGFSLGASYALDLFAIEPRIRAAAFAGVGATPHPQLLPANRTQLALFFQTRVPTLLNPPGAPLVTSIGGLPTAAPWFNENLPPRGAAPLVNTVPGALEIQSFLERAEWLQATTASGVYASFLRRKPLVAAARPFVLQIARGDQQIANPSTADLVREGDVADRATLYRHDLFANVAALKNPHTMLIRTDQPALRGVALQYQDEVGGFFASDGAVTPDPDGAGVLFEVPAATIPTDLGFIP